MHGLPCASLTSCFGNPSEVSAEPSQEEDGSRQRRNSGGPPPAQEPVVSQPKTQAQVAAEPQRSVSYASSTHGNGNGEIKNGQLSDPDEDMCFESSVSLSLSDEDEPESDYSPEVELRYPQIPRPSIIRYTEDPEFPDLDFQETWSDRSDYRENGELSDHCDPGLSLSAARSVMAEPDYLEGNCDELIKPKKLINPVKTSRNHQDLHRELLMNQKRGLAPQNKPELQKVLEKRKREQVLKAQKEEQEAHKKRSDLEIELMKRQQKLEQLELEQQKIDEEQENTPEFVKMKSNLRRTKQEAESEERTT